MEVNVGIENDLILGQSMTFKERQDQIQFEETQEKEQREREKKSPYENWIQINKDAYKSEDWLMAKSPIAYRVFKFLMNNMDGYNAVVCSYKVLQEYFDISQDTVRRAIKLLKEKKYVDVHKSGTSNIYTVNKRIAWNSWGKNYRYAKFGANIVLTESEQDSSKVKTVKHKEVQLKE